MEDTLKIKSDRDIFYYRQRMKNRVFAKLVQFFAEEAERTGITKKDISKILRKDPAQITRWLSAPTNLTLDTISDLLLALDAEIDPSVVRFSDRAKRNYVHPLIARVTGTPAAGLHGSQTKTLALAPRHFAEPEINISPKQEKILAFAL